MIKKVLKTILQHPTVRRLECIDRRLERHQKRHRIPFIKDHFPKNGVGAELGVFKGHLSPILQKYTQPAKLHLIDPWYFLSGRWSWATGNQSTVDALTRILRNFKKSIEAGRVVVHVGDDLEVLRSFPDDYLDWAYIDSSHNYEHTSRELVILEQKVKENGIIAGDDWLPDPNHRHHGVFRAVNQFLTEKEGQYHLLYANPENRQWAIGKLDPAKV